MVEQLLGVALLQMSRLCPSHIPQATKCRSDTVALCGRHANSFEDGALFPHFHRDAVDDLASVSFTLADYDHLAPALEILRPYLRRASASRQRGVNVLLYGVPGTGKTQLAKVLAQELGAELFEIAREDNHGDPIGGERRLRAFRAAQTFFAQRQTLLLCDEIEDVFNQRQELPFQQSNGQNRNGWINRCLEGNPVPAFWVTNSIDHIDKAFIRRFDVSLEVPVPPLASRERIVRAACDGRFGGDQM